MRRFQLNWLILCALSIALVVPQALFGQMDDRGGGGFRRGRRGGGFYGRFGGQMFNQNQPQPNAKPDEKPKDEKKDEKPAEKKPDPGPKPITRPPAMDMGGAGGDQHIKVDDKKLVSFNFQEAPWTVVLEELARVSGMNLDWQQLPGDALNLRSNSKYNVVQARDLINSHLMARGYSMLVDTKTSTITVVNLDNLNTALVPRVAPEDLERLQPHDLVKVSFRLDWLLAKEAAEEFKEMLSPKGKLLALKTTNRIEAIDAVENLRQLWALLDEEQGGPNGNDRLVKEFELRYTRAGEVLDQLQTFLGLKKDAIAAPKNPQEAMMQQQMMMQRMGQPAQPGQPGQPGAVGQAKPETRLVANMRLNSILVSAPPDQMAVVRAAIFKLDVPGGRAGLGSRGHLAMKTYRLATADPEVVVNVLESVGDLDPQTRLDVDKKNRAIIAFASPHDHESISSVLKNLDGSDRSIQVIKLRRLDAVDAAGTLRMLLVGDEANASNNNNGGGRRYGWYSSMFSSNTNEEKDTGKFRIEGDIANNRLILWANKIETDQVMKCLAELGEVPRREAGQDTVRVLDLGDGDSEQQTLDRLRSIWPTISGKTNKLIIDVPEKKADKKTDQDSAKDESMPKKIPGRNSSGTVPSASNADLLHRDTVAQGLQNSALVQPDPAVTIRLADLTRTTGTNDRNLAEADAGVKQAEPKETVAPADRETRELKSEIPMVKGVPIHITRGPDGKLVISSSDTQALDALEEAINRLAPPRKDYKVFYLKHASALSVKYLLEDLFISDKKESGENRYRRWIWDIPDDKGDSSPRLSQRRPLKFVEDSQTNSILVQGATADQLRRIEEMIDVYDQPEPKNSTAARMTRPFPIVHAKASAIAEVIKEVYRDLLSANDKALESYNQTKNQGRGGRGYFSFGSSDDDDGKINQNKFKGLLSVGVEELSNTLIVSCPQGLMSNVEQIVMYLDKAAVPTAQTYQVLRIDRSIDAGALQKKLAEMLKQPTSAKTEHPNAQQPQQPKRGGRGRQNNNNNNNSNNDQD